MLRVFGNLLIEEQREPESTLTSKSTVCSCVWLFWLLFDKLLWNPITGYICNAKPKRNIITSSKESCTSCNSMMQWNPDGFHVSGTSYSTYLSNFLVLFNNNFQLWWANYLLLLALVTNLLNLLDDCCFLTFMYFFKSINKKIIILYSFKCIGICLYFTQLKIYT